MRAKAEERTEARRLRALGMSVRTIALELGVAKSSVSVWVRDIPGPPKPPRPKKVVGRRPGPSVVPGPGRVCGMCRRELTLESFNRAGDGHQHWCRECFKAYFRERGAKHREQSAAAKAARKAPARAFVLDVLSRSWCADCGEDEIAVLEFDHVGVKHAGVAVLVREGASPDRLRQEIERCEVVCACCHRRRTARRAGWTRATGIPAARWTAAQRRNHEHIVDALRLTGCIDCGEQDPVVLEFDHIGEKTASVARLLAIQASLTRIKAEIAQCEVRCCNCHRLVTRARLGSTWRGSLDWLESTN